MKVIKIKTHRNGSATMTYELNNVDTAFFKELAKKRKKKFNITFINKEVLKALKEAVINDTKTSCSCR